VTNVTLRDNRGVRGYLSAAITNAVWSTAGDPDPMNIAKRALFLFVVFLAAGRTFATTFVVPDDAELVQKSDAIVTGVVTASRAVEAEDGYVETIYTVALDGVLKGPFQPHSVIEINSPGGATEKRFTIVESAAHFAIGDQVLLFLIPHRGGWTTTDMTLGKFRFAVSSGGFSVAVRDADDIVGWDRDGKVHREQIRLEEEFLQFIRETVAGRTADRKYEAEAGEVLATPPAAQARAQLRPVTNLSPGPATTYSVSFFDCALNRYPGRWETATMNAGVPFYKNSAQNASGLGDGGVSKIQSALAAWTNDCGSAVNIVYGGTSANLKDGGDGVNVVVFNDPGNHIGGSWTGSGVVATCFSSGGDSHTFDGGDWVSISDSDVVFQNGYAGTEASIEEAMTHEIGHGIGLRHADKHYLKTCSAPGCVISCSETACNTGVEDCSALAIMTATVNLSLNFTLQAWDMSAADALYPSTCVVVTPPTNVVATATSASNVQITWTASVGAASYNVYRSPDTLTYSLAGNTISTTFNDGGRSANTAYLYKVRAVNGGESTDSDKDLATTTIFTDDPLVGGTTAVQATHLTQLRTAVDAVRTLAALGGGSYTDPTLIGGATSIKAAHVNELRTALDAARLLLSQPALSYAETITASTTAIKTSHINELRNGVK
jgi:hypothetical protein